MKQQQMTEHEEELAKLRLVHERVQEMHAVMLAACHFHRLCSRSIFPSFRIGVILKQLQLNLIKSRSLMSCSAKNQDGLKNKHENVVKKKQGRE